MTRILMAVWIACLIIGGIGLLYLTFSPGVIPINQAVGGVLLCFLLFGMALLAEYIDSSLGMGYGTVLCPVLLIFGYTPLQIVPALLFSEFLSGVAAGGYHHRVGNVDLRIGTLTGKTALIIAACSLVGTVTAVFVAITIPTLFVKVYIGSMILCIGIFIILSKGTFLKFSWGKIVGLGLVAAFNKGISGGGYGPLVTGGQVMLGVPSKSAVGITSLAEGLSCFVGLVLYVIFRGALDWTLAVPLALGAFLSVPVAVWTVKLVPEHRIRGLIGYVTVFLGALTLIKIIGV